ncbi:hypothetical protein JCM14450A_27740 [Geobacillus stearothermophilus]
MCIYAFVMRFATRSSTKQPPFSPKLSIEALYGIFAQVEGQNISGRRKDTMKQFPSSIFGYKRIGKRKDVKYPWC